MAEVDPDQQAALRRLRAAFGFVEVLRVVDHDQGQDQDDDQPTEDGGQAPPAPTGRSARRRRAAAVDDPLALVRIRPQ
jgi:hypothetical protein